MGGEDSPDALRRKRSFRSHDRHRRRKWGLRTCGDDGDAFPESESPAPALPLVSEEEDLWQRQPDNETLRVEILEAERRLWEVTGGEVVGEVPQPRPAPGATLRKTESPQPARATASPPVSTGPGDRPAAAGAAASTAGAALDAHSGDREIARSARSPGAADPVGLPPDAAAEVALPVVSAQPPPAATQAGSDSSGLLQAGIAEVEARVRSLVAQDPGQIGLYALVAVAAPLLLFRLMRKRGDLSLFIAYPSELHGTFRVRLYTSERRAARIVQRGHREILKGGTSNSREHFLVSRETRFGGLPDGSDHATDHHAAVSPV